MGVKAFTDAVRDLLTADATFVAEVAACLGAPVSNVLRANTPWAAITAQQLPCYVMEQGDGQASNWSGGDDSGLTIGHQQQAFASELDVCLLWNEPSRDNAADQRAQLPAIFARLLMRNPQPGGVSGAWLQQWVPDQGVMHPRQCWVARLHVEFVIEE